MRAIHWQVRFKSLTEKSCIVNVYEDEYTGDVVELTGADDAFYFEENDSDDLLEVIRYRTGYLRVIEESNNELADLYPTTTFSRYLEFYYEGVLMFTGFIQLQNVEIEWTGCPRVVEFPVISPLGLLANVNLPVMSTPQPVSLGQELYNLLGLLHCNYEKVIFPDVTPGLDSTLEALVVNPWNDDFAQSQYMPITPYFTGIDGEEFITGICNCYGWMVHDTPDGLFFSRYDYNGVYSYFDKADLPYCTNKHPWYFNGDAGESVETHFTLMDDHGRQSVILPKRNVTLQMEGEHVTECGFDFQHMRFLGFSEYGNQVAGWFDCEDSPEMSGDWIRNRNTFNGSNGKLTNPGVMTTRCGNPGSVSDYIMVNVGSNMVGSDLFELHFYEPPTGNKMQFSYSVKWGNYIRDLARDSSIDHWNLWAAFRVDNQYYQGSGNGWGVNKVSFQMLGQDPSIIIEDVPRGTFHVEFSMAMQMGSPVDLLALSNVKLESLPGIFDDLRVYQNDEIVLTNGNGVDDTSVSLLFNAYRVSSNQLGRVVYSNLFTYYRYMREPTARLQVKMRPEMTYGLLRALYVAKWDYWVYGWCWRIVNFSFHPWDDEMEIALFHSLVNDE
jgi:hypothetical protein